MADFIPFFFLSEWLFVFPRSVYIVLAWFVSLPQGPDMFPCTFAVFSPIYIEKKIEKHRIPCDV